ncbi:MAG: Ig-like domain-containing protein [Bacteroidales bacterium]
MKRVILIVPALFLISLFLPRCAVIVQPTGGPKDTIPPVLVRSEPPKNSTNFSGQRVRLTFDEFIKLEQISQKLVLSPPQERLPEFRIRGKSLDLTFFEELDDSTTYTLYFSNAIVDNNEGNELENFEFAFSTGPEIDSMRFKGRVIDAFTLEPVEGALVMLYTSFHDSIPINERPRYVTKSNKEGTFTLSNLMQSDYKIFALKDENSNYLFDQISENIAFTPDTISPSDLIEPYSDTLQPKSKEGRTLRLFQEEDKRLTLTDYKREQPRALSFGFSRKPLGDVDIVPIDAPYDTSKVWYELERNVKGDSLVYWLLDDELRNNDTLVVKATYQRTDSLMNLYQTTDTLRMFYDDKSSKGGGRSAQKEDDEEKKPALAIKTSPSSGRSILPHQRLSLSFNMPLEAIDTTLIGLENTTDSVSISSFSLAKDTLNPTKYHIKHSWKNNTGYALTILPQAFTNLDGVTNDTLVHSFKGADPERFGKISLDLTGVTTDVILELIGSSDKVVDRKITEKDSKVVFSYIKPGTYKLRIIVDRNRNGKWDTGNYLKGVQPERVIIYEDKETQDIQVKANWEYEVSYKLKQ